MKIVESAQQHNPQQIAQLLTSPVNQLKMNVQTAAQDGESFDGVERTVLTSGLKIGNQAIELLLALQGDGNLGEASHYPPGDGRLFCFSPHPELTKGLHHLLPLAVKWLAARKSQVETP